MSEPTHLEGRLLAVDLRDLPEENMAELRRAAIQRGVSLPDMLGEMLAEKSRELVASRRMVSVLSTS